MTLKITLLGQFHLQANARPIELRSRPAQSLLAYIALNAGTVHRREKLAGLLWPDSTDTNARNYLRQALWRIRKSLTNAALDWEAYLKINNISVKFESQSDYWIDVQDFLQSAQDWPVERVMDSLRLYRGELLPGFYDEWIEPERNRIQAAHQQKMHQLLTCLCDSERWQEILEWGEKWIRQGHSPEAAFRALMHAHAGLGNHGMVSATYQRCVETLERELSLSPSPETRRLYDQILHEEHAEAAPARMSLQAVYRPRFLEDAESEPLEKPVFVARDRELAQVEGHRIKAFDGQGRVIFITGEVGSGKSSLLQEFTRRVLHVHPEALIAGGTCNAHTGIGDPYLPFREILGMLTGDVDDRWAGGTITRQHAQRLWDNLPIAVKALLECSPDLINTFIPGDALLKRAAAHPAGSEPWRLQLKERIDRKASNQPFPSPQQTDLFEQVWHFLQELSSEHPLMIMLDDLQWADAGSISLLFHLGRKLGHSPILIMGAYRQEEVALGRQGSRHPLEPVVNEFQREFGASALNLDKVDRREFVEAFLDSEPNKLSPSFRTMLHRQTRGHPLFTIELLRGMQERGDLVRDQDGMWIEGAALDWETMPVRVEAVIAERIGRLDHILQTALQVASVEGDVFTAEVLARVMQINERDLLGRLSEELDRRHHLIRAESIQRVHGQCLSSYRFRNILFQKFLYTNLNKVELVHLHEEVGRTLESLHGSEENISRIALQLARHFEQAGIPQKAIGYLHQAGERAIQLCAYTEGINHLSRSMDILRSLPDSPERDETELSLQLSIGMAWKYNWSSMQGKEAINRARALSLKYGKITNLARVMGEFSIFHYVRAEYQQAMEWAHEALLLAQQTDDPILTAEGHWVLGFLNFCIGEYTIAHEHFQHVIEFYNPDLHHHALISLRGVDAGLSAMAYDACCLWCLGYPDQAHAYSHKALSLAHSFQHAFTLADVLSYAGCMFHAMLGDPQVVSESAEALFQISVEEDFYLAGWSGMAKSFMGIANIMQGQATQAIAQIQDSIEQCRSTGVLLYQAISLQSLAQALALDGQIQKGLETLAEALVVVEETNDRHWEAELYRLRGDLLLNQADEAGAENSYRKSLTITRNQSAKSWELRTAMGLAKLWMQQGKWEQARSLLEPIYAWFTEGLDTPDLRAAKAILEETS